MGGNNFCSVSRQFGPACPFFAWSMKTAFLRPPKAWSQALPTLTATKARRMRPGPKKLVYSAFTFRSSESRKTFRPCPLECASPAAAFPPAHTARTLRSSISASLFHQINANRSSRTAGSAVRRASRSSLMRLPPSGNGAGPFDGYIVIRYIYSLKEVPYRYVLSY